MAAGLSAIGGLASFGAGIAQAGAEEAQGEFQDAVAQANARFSTLKAEDAIRRGDKVAGAYGEKVGQTIGAQRAALAAQGIDVDAGSAADIQDETRLIGAEEAETIKNNAFREAMGFKTEALSQSVQGKLALAQGKSRAAGSILGGGLSFLKGAADAFPGSKLKAKNPLARVRKTEDFASFNTRFKVGQA